MFNLTATFSRLFLGLLLASFSLLINAQNEFNYKFHLEPMQINGLEGLHSYAFGQLDGKWILIGGRTDGIHARQPFNAFPESQNNTTIYVVDPVGQVVWTSDFQNLPIAIQEQLQSTNMQFYQDGQRLIFVGGYGYSPTEGDHITYPYLTAINLEGLIDVVINEDEIINYFDQIIDDNFAVTGGNLGKIGDEFLLVGGHRFDGRYNPMNHPTFTQTYTNQIRKFNLNYDPELVYNNYEAVTDEINLHRRDYNLQPQIFPDGTFGYTLFSGVFQINQNLPFLYPVDIFSDSHIPQNNFNQLLNNYHSATVPLYDSVNNAMHTIFFGGISQYFYANGTLIQDNDVPFVKTISRVSRASDGTLLEAALPQLMPAYLGSSAEFILNESLGQTTNGVIHLDQLETDSTLIGYIFGGIESPEPNPFTFNNTGATFASNTIFKVYLIPEQTTSNQDIELNGYHDFSFKVYPNPSNDTSIFIDTHLNEPGSLEVLFSDAQGKLLVNELFDNLPQGEKKLELQLPVSEPAIYFLTIVSNGKYFATEKVVLTK